LLSQIMKEMTPARTARMTTRTTVFFAFIFTPHG
jgi:hypothetical protein